MECRGVVGGGEGGGKEGYKEGEGDRMKGRGGVAEYQPAHAWWYGAPSCALEVV